MTIWRFVTLFSLIFVNHIFITDNFTGPPLYNGRYACLVGGKVWSGKLLVEKARVLHWRETLIGVQGRNMKARISQLIQGYRY